MGTGLDAASQVSDVLRRYPATDGIFLQQGPLFVAQPGQLYLQYPEQTVGEYAARHGLDLEALLRWLNAEAGAADLEAPASGQRARPPGRPPEGPIGYTGAYVELAGSGIESEPVVASRVSRGPY